MDLQPAHFRFIDLLAEQAGLAVHFFALLAVDRNIVIGVGKLGIQGGFFRSPLRHFFVQLLDFLEQRAALGEQGLTAGLGVSAVLQAFSLSAVCSASAVRWALR